MSLANPTMGVLFEVLSGEDGCADHFPDECCTLCAGWKHLIEHGYLSRGPEELARFKKAFHAQKKVPSGWDAQVEADEKERAGASKPPGRGTPAQQPRQARFPRTASLRRRYRLMKRQARIVAPPSLAPTRPPRTEEYDCAECGKAAHFLHMGSAWCSVACRDEWVRAANQAVVEGLK